MKANYHTHTRWCRHGSGEIEDFVREAIKKGLDTLAVTEHVPYRSNFDGRRMQWEEFSAYNQELEAVIQKYEGRLHIIKGFECEYNPAVMEDYQRFREEYGYDLMILGQHLSTDHQLDYFAPKGEKEFSRYTDEVLCGLETGFFTFLAHPEVALNGYQGSAGFAESQIRRIFEACERLRIPVEINANGLRGNRAYPDWSVWVLSKEYRLKRLINSDAHSVPDLCDEAGVLAAEKRCAALGIPVTERLTDIG